MNIVKLALAGLALAVVSMTGVVATSSDAEAHCRKCRGKVVRHTRRTVHRTRRPVRYVTRHTKSYRTRHVRHLRTRRVVRHIRPIVKVRRIHTVYNRTVVHHQRRTVYRTVRHAPRYMETTEIRHVRLPTRHVSCGCR